MSAELLPGDERPTVLVESATLSRISDKLDELAGEFRDLQLALIRAERPIQLRRSDYSMTLGVRVRQDWSPDGMTWAAIDAGSDDEADWSSGHPTREIAISTVLVGKLRRAADNVERNLAEMRARHQQGRP